jgi:protein-tyrosine phosphatase
MNGIFWIQSNPSVPLAVVLCPQGDRRLYAALTALKWGGIDTLVSLLETKEAGSLGLAEESYMAEEIGLRFLSFPIPDTQIPSDTAAFQEFVAGLADRLRAGERIGVHCRGSIGRATVTAACTLIHLGWEPAAALAAVEASRGCQVPDTPEQERWILNYKAEP